MRRYKLFLFLILNTCFVFAQREDTGRRGTIKISKLNPDSIYIKAEMNFLQFQEGNKKTEQQKNIQFKNAVSPFPIVFGYNKPFDYNLFFNKIIEVDTSNLENKITDTIRIQIKILDNGKAYYKDLAPLITMGGVPAYYNNKMNAYKLDAIHWKCLNILKQIKVWEPAYLVVGINETFKNTTVIKPKKKKLSATGILTIIFSRVSFEN